MTDDISALITRLGTTARASLAVNHRGTGYFAVTPDAPYDGSLTTAEQARQLLVKSEKRLLDIGSDKGRILFVATLLADIGDIADYNAVWDEWIAGVAAPARATFQAQLASPALKIEQIVICATD